MVRPRVKICGITNIKDAELCLKLGADMLGFIFYEKSPRHVRPETAGEIIEKLKNNHDFESVGVFVNSGRDFVEKAAASSGIDILQFHGDESQEFIQNFKKKKIKAFRITNLSDIDRCNNYKDVDFFLFDTFSKEAYGGTGEVFNWKLLSDFFHRNRLFLAGGIDGDNIKEAIKTVMPFAVDASSRLEEKPGKKDKIKLEKFFRAINNL